MKHFILFTLCFLLFVSTRAQKPKYINIAIFTTQNAMPFGKFAGMFKEIFHPGIEFSYGKTLHSAKKHDWFTELNLAYFFHRFVQHGIPLYLNAGYRYKFNKRLAGETSIGAGYMHSIPATAKLKLNDNGDYTNDKKAGRMQAMGTYTIKFSYVLSHNSANPISIFTSYQQRVQFPFVKSYVPLLPYNSLFIGISKPIHTKKSKNKSV
ncbi:MAG: hypothetical protein WAT34_13670 [Chitinophagaceae bacterium]|nr:hypothetical protein [Chitinophagaceae bacterium]